MKAAFGNVKSLAGFEKEYSRLVSATEKTDVVLIEMKSSGVLKANTDVFLLTLFHSTP